MRGVHKLILFIRENERFCYEISADCSWMFNAFLVFSLNLGGV